MANGLPPNSLPTWATGPQSLGHRIDLVVRFIVALIVTPLFVGISIGMRQFHVLLLVVVMLVIVTFVGPGGQLLERYPLLGRVKLIGGALRVSHDLDVFYREHRPRGFLYYAVYPFYALIGLVASKVVRRELKLHAKLAGVVLVLLLLEAAAGYGTSYPPYLGVKEAALLLAAQVAVLLFCAAMYLLPMMTTVYSLALSGKRRALRGLLLGSLLLSVPMGYAGWLGTADVVPWLEQMRLRARMHKAAFQSDVYDMTEMFLDHAAEHELIDADGPHPRVHHKATERFRRMVRGLVLGAEYRAFDVISFREKDSKEKDLTKNPVWTGVRVVLGSRAYLLLLRSPSGDMFRRFGELPEDVRKRFVVGVSRQRSGPAEIVNKRGLIVDISPPE